MYRKRVDKLGRKYKKREIWKNTQSMAIASTQLELREMSASPSPSDKTMLTIQSLSP